LRGVFAIVLDGDAENRSHFVAVAVEFIVSNSVEQLLERGSRDGKLSNDLLGGLGAERVDGATVRSVNTLDRKIEQRDALAEEILADGLDFAALPKQSVGENVMYRPLARLHRISRIIFGKTTDGAQ
jgi:hypothetical protein